MPSRVRIEHANVVLAASYRPWRRTIAGRITPISGLVSLGLFIYLLAAAAAAGVGGPLADVTQFTG